MCNVHAFGKYISFFFFFFFNKRKGALSFSYIERLYQSFKRLIIINVGMCYLGVCVCVGGSEVIVVKQIEQTLVVDLLL